MGHERVGALPKSKRWRAVVEAISACEHGDIKDVAEVAERTLQNVKSRFSRIHKDRGVQAAFAYLVALASEHLPSTRGLCSPKINLNENPSPVSITKQLGEWIIEHGGLKEYAEVAYRAGADTIGEWTRSQTRQGLLFDKATLAENIWSNSANANGFCQIARSFFAHFTERYMRYFLEREASAQLTSIDSREKFNLRLHEHIQDVSQHAFEISKITQSFAAGWFNKHARTHRPSDKEVEGFLAIAFGKIQEELQRESI